MFVITSPKVISELAELMLELFSCSTMEVINTAKWI